MTSVRRFSDVSGLHIEVEDTGGATGDPSLGEALEGIRAIVSQTAATLGQLPAEQRPTELSLRFSLRAISGGYAVSQDADLANFALTLSWSQEPAVPGPDIPDVPAP